MSMSLDGYVADRDDGVSELHAWYGSGAVETSTATPGVAFRTSEASATVLRSALANAGALITGRRNFDIAGGSGGNHPLGVPVVVTHSIPDGWPREEAPFTFIAGVEARWPPQRRPRRQVGRRRQRQHRPAMPECRLAGRGRGQPGAGAVGGRDPAALGSTRGRV
jgi:hypothetical protein